MRAAIIVLSLALSGCAALRPLPDAIMNVPQNLHEPCPNATALTRIDADVQMRFIGTPGHRLFGCGTLAVSTIQLYVPANVRVHHWDRVGGPLAYAFQMSRDGKRFTRRIEFATPAQKHRVAVLPSVEIKVYRAAAPVEEPTRYAYPPFVQQQRR